MDSYDVRFWDTRKISDNGSGGRYRVRWAVDDREHCKSFRNKTLADGFLDSLKDAARSRRPFSQRTGLPAAETTQGEMITWYEHARRYAEAKWAGLAPVSRRSVAEALVTVTIALTAKEKGAPEGRVLRQALFGWAFNPATREQVPPREIAAALSWVARASLPVAALDDPATVRLALGACARTLAGKPAAGSTQRRKRSVFYNALGYAVEQGHLAANPVDRIQWTAPAVAQSVDRRVVVSPAQARKLLAAVRGLSDRGAHLEAFYALPVLRGAAPVGGGHAPRDRPVPAGEGVGADRAGRLRLPRRAELDRPRHRPPGTRPEAPRRHTRQGPSLSRPNSSGCSAPTSRGTGRPRTGGSSRPAGAGSSRTRPTARCGPTPGRAPSPKRSSSRRSADVPTTCGTRRCRCG